MKKTIIVLAVVACLAVMSVVGATLAYLTDQEEATNVFTVGNVDIVLTEPNWDATGKEEAKDVYPGEPLAKDPTVENVGANPCFVRISVSALDQFAEEYNGAMITYRTDYVEGALGENWVYNENDKYFYYTKVLAVGEKTDALFDQIVIPFALENSETTEDIIVTAQAVQAQGARPSFSAVQAMTVDEIAAWFTTCGF